MTALPAVWDCIWLCCKYGPNGAWYNKMWRIQALWLSQETGCWLQKALRIFSGTCNAVFVLFLSLLSAYMPLATISRGCWLVWLVIWLSIAFAHQGSRGDLQPLRKVGQSLRKPQCNETFQKQNHLSILVAVCNIYITPVTILLEFCWVGMDWLSLNSWSKKCYIWYTGYLDMEKSTL